MPLSRRRAGFPIALMLGSVLTGPVLLAGCAGPAPSQAELSRQTDCRAEADRQYEKRNRYLLSEQDQTGTPFSSHGLPGDTTTGLSDLYGRDRAVDNCLRTGDPAPAAASH